MSIFFIGTALGALNGLQHQFIQQIKEFRQHRPTLSNMIINEEH
jgi:hypothetical protein